MVSLLLFMWMLVVGGVVVEARFQCGVCVCNEEEYGLRAVCTGLGLSALPVFEKSISDRIAILGLSGNKIVHITTSDLDRFPSLYYIEVLRQENGCVHFPALISASHLMINGV